MTESNGNLLALFNHATLC